MTRTRWLKYITRDAVVIAFRDWFGLQHSQAEVLATLFERSGRPIKPRALGAEMNAHRPLNDHAVMERISGLRIAMVSEAIDTTVEGYVLTEVGLSECRHALGREAEALARMAREFDEEGQQTGAPLRRLG
jgi:hypothetical protein